MKHQLAVLQHVNSGRVSAATQRKVMRAQWTASIGKGQDSCRSQHKGNWLGVRKGDGKASWVGQAQGKANSVRLSRLAQGCYCRRCWLFNHLFTATNTLHSTFEGWVSAWVSVLTVSRSTHRRHEKVTFTRLCKQCYYSGGLWGSIPSAHKAVQQQQQQQQQQK
jgi:hypothetical protein